MTLRVERLTEPGPYIETILEWHWREWSQFSANPSKPQWRQNLLDALGDTVPYSVAAFVGDDPVGYARVCDDDLDERFADRGPWISGMYVTGQARNLGVGRQILSALEGYAAQLGITELWLHTAEARAFYERCGWEVVAPKDGLDTDTVMRRAVSFDAR